MTVHPADVDKYLGPTLVQFGFSLEMVDTAVIYGDRPAWAVYYRALDCKLQVCWSARDGGIDFLLAPLEAPDQFGPSARAQGWQYLLILSTSDDSLTTPGLDASEEVWWKWRKDLLLAHFDEARDALSSNR